MSKRGAEKQLTDRNWDRDDEDGNDESNDGTFAIAPPTALAQRKIRGMPQRKTASPALPTTATNPDLPSKPSPFGAGSFGGFSFGSSTAGSAFTLPSSTGGTKESTASRGAFDTGTTAKSAFSFGSPSSTPSAFGTAQTSATSPFGSSSPSFTFGTATTVHAALSQKHIEPASTIPTPPPPSNREKTIKYYMSLRALNLAVIEALNKSIETDPFVNLVEIGSGNTSGFTKLKTRYEEERKRIEAEMRAGVRNGDIEGMSDTVLSKVNGNGNSSATSSQATTTTAMEIESPQPVKPIHPSSIPSILTSPPVSTSTSPTPAASPPEPSISQEPAKPIFSVPTPPTTFSWAGNIVKPPSAVTSTVAAAGGFKPIFGTGDVQGEKSAFSFPVSAVVPSTSHAESSAHSTSSVAPPPISSSTLPTSSNSKPVSAGSTLPSRNSRASSLKLANTPSAPSPLRYGESVSPELADKALPVVKAGGEEEGERREESNKAATTDAAGFSFGASFGHIAKEGSGGTSSDFTTSNPFSNVAATGTKSSSVTTSSDSKPAPTFSATAPFSFGSKASSPVPNPFSVPPVTMNTATTTATATSAAIPIPVPSAKDTPHSAFAFGNFGATPATKPSSGPASSPPIATAFGTGSSPPSFNFGAALATKTSTPFSSKSPGFSFGSSSSPAASSNKNPPHTTSTTGFSFGSAIAPPSVQSPTFTHPTSTTGFSFGGTGTGAAVSETVPAKMTTGFSFGGGNPTSALSMTGSMTPATVSSAAPSESGVDEGTVADTEDGSHGENGENPLAGKGEGEEDEETLLESRGKVVRLENTGPKDVGVATLLVKERETDGKKVRRLLARNEVTGSVLMNFRLGPQFQVKMEKTFLTFLGFEGTEPQMFRLRLKTKEQTEELKQELERAATDAGS